MVRVCRSKERQRQAKEVLERGDQKRHAHLQFTENMTLDKWILKIKDQNIRLVVNQAQSSFPSQCYCYLRYIFFNFLLLLFVVRFNLAIFMRALLYFLCKLNTISLHLIHKVRILQSMYVTFYPHFIRYKIILILLVFDKEESMI